MKKITFLLLSVILSTTYLNAQTQATYEVTFTSEWSQATHPHSSGSLPSNAHWSKLVGATHNDAVSFLEMGETATPGIENVAEAGNKTVFFSEVNTAISADTAGMLIDGPDLPSSAGQVVVENIITTQDHPLLTLVSMIAPSPDWIIAISNVELMDSNGDWKDTITLDLFPYDAGTDNGVDYTSANIENNPKDPISSAQGITPFSSARIGTITIELQSVLGVNGQLSQTLSMSPNPTRGQFTIQNNNPLQSLGIYDVLGSKVMDINPRNNTRVEADLSALNSGIYLVNITDNQGQTVVKKLLKQ